MTEKRQTSQGYIICILQHFATKLRNINNFVMKFFLSSCDEIFVQAYLDQNFTQKGKGLLWGQFFYQIENGRLSVEDGKHKRNKIIYKFNT
jgi:hypothetical protein